LASFRIIVVPLVLHPGIQGDHRQVVGIGDIINIACQPQREFGHRDQQSLSPPAAVPLTFMVGPPEG